jgi:chromosome segregation ATPase
MAAPDQRPGPGSYTKNNSETFKLKMELLVAERRYSDLLLKNSHLESDNKHLESKNQHLERDNKVLARKLELESATKASVIQHAEESITDLLDQLSRIHTDFEAARQEAGQIREQNQILHAEKSQLSNDLSLLRTTNIELDERNQQLSAMHTTSQEDKVNLARLTDDRRSLRARNESNEKEMEVLRDRIAAVETDLDW